MRMDCLIYIYKYTQVIKLNNMQAHTNVYEFEAEP